MALDASCCAGAARGSMISALLDLLIVEQAGNGGGEAGVLPQDRDYVPDRQTVVPMPAAAVAAARLSWGWTPPRSRSATATAGGHAPSPTTRLSTCAAQASS
jgi:hypothetical protein